MKLIPSAMVKTKAAALMIGSTDFGHMDYIPSKFSCEDQNVNPVIVLDNIPPGTQNSRWNIL